MVHDCIHTPLTGYILQTLQEGKQQFASVMFNARKDIHYDKKYFIDSIDIGLFERG
jgi:hypothetical protein